MLSANAALSQVLGRSIDAIEGSAADFLIAGNADSAQMERLQTALRLNQPLQETLSLQISGRHVWIGMRLMPAVSPPPARLFVLLGRDITPTAVPLSLALIDLPKSMRRSLDTAMLTLPDKEIRGFDPTRLRLAGLLEEALKQGATDKTATWILPVDYDSMTLRYRRSDCLEQLSKLPPALRQRVTPLLSQLPRSFYQARVDETLRVLRTFGRAVGIEVDDLDALPFDPKGRSVGLVVVKAANLLSLVRRNRAAGVAATLKRLRSEAIRVIVRDTAEFSEADLAELGIEFLINETD